MLRTDPLYRAWTNMRQRCRNINDTRYGGRGIGICARWNEFKLFEKDMAPHPGKGWSLDRKKNHLGYSKGNCHWATAETQNRNRRPSTRSGKLTMNDAKAIRRSAGSCSKVALATRYNVHPSMIHAILRGTTWY